MNLALFDFDGTITFQDTFTPFIHFAVDPTRIALGTLALSPMIVGYKLGLVPATRMRAAAAYLGFRGRQAADMKHLGARYSTEVLESVIRPAARDRILWHKSRGDVVVVVSASLDAYLRAWCDELEVELICTELEVRSGVLTGRYAGGDCTGREKARRVVSRYDLSRYPIVYAYGDTEEDRHLLHLATKRYFRWREVEGGDEQALP